VTKINRKLNESAVLIRTLKTLTDNQNCIHRTIANISYGMAAPNYGKLFFDFVGFFRYKVTNLYGNMPVT